MEQSEGPIDTVASIPFCAAALDQVQSIMEQSEGPIDTVASIPFCAAALDQVQSIMQKLNNTAIALC